MVSQARQRAEDAAGRTQRLQELTAALAASATEREVGDIVMQYGVLPTGAYAGVIAERIDADTLELRTSVGYPPTACMVVGRRWPVDASIPLVEAARTGEAVFVGSPDEWASRYPRGYSPAASAPVVPSSQSQAWAAFPLHTEHGGRGAILWAFATPREFSDEDRRFMETVAQQGAQALERARLREAERRARAEAEDANRAKSEFLARMSHDLRTPLNAIGGYAQLIEEGVYGDPTEGQRQSLARIRRAQQHLLTLINDVLSFAKLEAGQVRVKATPVAMADIITSLRSLIDPVASAKGLAFKVADGPPDIVLRTDADRVIQIVGNLLTNATKFTDAGGTITLGWTVAGDRASITVTDTGQGIAPDRVTTIFEPFVQLEGPAHENRQGVGLGLAIGRELARMLNGDLNVESTLGQGSTFTLRLPLETSRVLVGAEAG
jgi:signal transduction histidine kinase